MKVGEGLWDFDVKLEDWPSAKGLSRDMIMVEMGEGLIWVLEELLQKWEEEEFFSCICWDCGEASPVEGRAAETLGCKGYTF